MKDLFTKLYVKCSVSKTKLAVFLKDKISNISEENKKIYKRCFTVAAAILVFAIVLGLTSQAFFAGNYYNPDVGTLQEDYKDLFNNIYTILMIIVNPLAVVLVAYNIIVIMSSKNQKKCDTAFTWIKAIAIAWLCFMLVSLIIKLALDWFEIGMIAQQNNGTSHSGPLFEY